MRRIIYVLLASAVTLAVAWALAGLPGRVSAQFGATTMEMATPIAILALLVIFVVLYTAVRLLAGLLRLPRLAARWDGARDRRRGDTAVTRALLALAAGDKSDARRQANLARRLLGETPQTLLLTAEAGRMAGRDDEAADAFRRLAEREDGAFLGYRGLLRQALDRQDWTEAATLASRAEAAHPGAAWLRNQRERLAVRSGRWMEALDYAETESARAALATAAADADGQDPARAAKLARQAWQADASLAPAALAHARRLRAEGREARAQGVIRHSWALAPHPELAAFALAGTDDRLAKVQAAQRLAEANPEHAESRLLLARTSLDAGLTGEARHQAALARDSGLNQRRLWLLLAEIKEAEHGGTESGQRASAEALRRAAEADADPEWRCTACQTLHAAWYAACTSCGTAGSLRWLPGRMAAHPTPAIVR